MDGQNPKKTLVPLRLGIIPTFEGSVGALTSRDVGAMVAFRTPFAAVLRSPISKKTSKDLATAVACREVAKKREKDMKIFFGSPEIFLVESRSKRLREGERNEESVGRKNFFLRRSLPVIPRRLWVTCFAILVMPC